MALRRRSLRHVLRSAESPKSTSRPAIRAVETRCRTFSGPSSIVSIVGSDHPDFSRRTSLEAALRAGRSYEDCGAVIMPSRIYATTRTSPAKSRNGPNTTSPSSPGASGRRLGGRRCGWSKAWRVLLPRPHDAPLRDCGCATRSCATSSGRSRVTTDPVISIVGQALWATSAGAGRSRVVDSSYRRCWVGGPALSRSLGWTRFAIEGDGRRQQAFKRADRRPHAAGQAGRSDRQAETSPASTTRPRLSPTDVTWVLTTKTNCFIDLGSPTANTGNESSLLAPGDSHFDEISFLNPRVIGRPRRALRDHRTRRHNESPSRTTTGHREEFVGERRGDYKVACLRREEDHFSGSKGCVRRSVFGRRPRGARYGSDHDKFADIRHLSAAGSTIPSRRWGAGTTLGSSFGEMQTRPSSRHGRDGASAFAEETPQPAVIGGRRHLLSSPIRTHPRGYGWNSERPALPDHATGDRRQRAPAWCRDHVASARAA